MNTEGRIIRHFKASKKKKRKRKLMDISNDQIAHLHYCFTQFMRRKCYYFKVRYKEYTFYSNPQF